MRLPPPRVARRTVEEKQRVLAAHAEGRDDWLEVASSNGIPASTAYDLIRRGRAEDLPRGGARRVKMTEEAKDLLEKSLTDDCTYTLDTMRTMLFLDCGVRVDTSTISRHLKGMLFTVTQVRIEPTTCNNDANKEKRRKFAEKLNAHQAKGNCVVYYDETNYNVYLKRTRGRARRASEQWYSSRLQEARTCRCNVPSPPVSDWLLIASSEAVFVWIPTLPLDEIYQAVKATEEFRSYFQGKKVVIVLDNAPAHCQMEARVVEHEDMELLRLGPYSPMCNPIEGCFSVLKSRIKRRLVLDRDDICNRGWVLDDNGNVIGIAERQMRILERAAEASMKCITPVLVSQMELHCSKAVKDAADGKNMVYGM